jgi:sialidase-1
MPRHLPCVFWIVFFFSATYAQFSEKEPATTLLFDSGQEGYKRYRIPALLTTSGGTVLAFCEGRKGGGGLLGDIDIVLKRSSDSGKTWQPLQIVADDGPHTLGNPCPVLDQHDGTIWLALTRSHGMDTEESITAGMSRETTRVFLTFSKDDGKTWSPLREISATTRQPNWTWYGTGPGIGIQLKSGRLLIPCYHAEAETEIYRSHMIYSDDHGTTWKLGSTVGEMCSECQVAERSDGTLVLSARTMKGQQQRTVALGKDAGQTWSPTERDPNLYDPGCQANIFRLTLGGQKKEEKNRWLYSHPAGPEGRRNLTVRLSYDEARTWPVGKVLRPGDSQYSCLAVLPDRSLGCLYDCWVNGNYRLYFARFSLDWLTDGKDKLHQ